MKISIFTIFTLLNCYSLANICNRTPAVVVALENELHLSCSQIQKTDLLSVKKLSIIDDQVKAFKADDFFQLSNIKDLSIGAPNLNFLASDLLKEMPKLQNFRLSKVTGALQIPECFFQHNQSLEQISIEETGITHIPEGLFKGLYLLNTLRINFNKITSFPTQVFRGLFQLKALMLEGNQIKSISRDHLFDLNLLQELYLNFNPITSLPNDLLYSSTNIQEVYFAFNNLSVLDKTTFSLNPKLRVIVLWGNQLSSLPENIFYATSLKSLDLRANSFSEDEIKKIQNNYKNLPELLL